MIVFLVLAGAAVTLALTLPWILALWVRYIDWVADRMMGKGK